MSRLKAPKVRFEGERPHVTSTGGEVVLSVWSTECVSCGAWFEQARSDGPRTIDTSKLVKRCSLCRPARQAEQSNT